MWHHGFFTYFKEVTSLTHVEISQSENIQFKSTCIQHLLLQEISKTTLKMIPIDVRIILDLTCDNDDIHILIYLQGF